MASTRRPPLRAQIAVLVVAVLVAGVGAAIWSRTVASDDDPVAADDNIRLSEPGEYGDPSLINPEHSGDDFPVVRVATIDGDRVELETDGRPMVVNIWHTRCPPCSRELQYFGEVARDVGADVRFVGVDPYDSGGQMAEFAARRDVGYELYLDDEYELFDALGVLSFPLTLFVSADGEIVAQTAEVSESELRDYVAALVA